MNEKALLGRPKTANPVGLTKIRTLDRLPMTSTRVWNTSHILTVVANCGFRRYTTVSITICLGGIIFGCGLGAGFTNNTRSIGTSSIDGFTRDHITVFVFMKWNRALCTRSPIGHNRNKRSYPYIQPHFYIVAELMTNHK